MPQTAPIRPQTLYISTCSPQPQHYLPFRPPKTTPKDPSFVLRIDTSATNLSCIYLTPLFNQSSRTRVRPLNCTSTSSPCGDYIFRVNTYISFNSSFFYPTTFDTSKESTPNIIFWCPASHLVKDGKENKSPQTGAHIDRNMKENSGY